MTQKLTTEQKLFKVIYGKPTTVEIIVALRKSNLPKVIKEEIIEHEEQWAEENL